MREVDRRIRYSALAVEHKVGRNVNQPGVNVSSRFRHIARPVDIDGGCFVRLRFGLINSRLGCSINNDGGPCETTQLQHGAGIRDIKLRQIDPDIVNCVGHSIGECPAELSIATQDQGLHE